MSAPERKPGAERPDEPSPNPWSQPRLVASIVVLAIIAVCALAVAVGGSTDSSDGASRSADGGRDEDTTTSEPDGRVEDVVGCSLPAGDQTVPARPPDARWEPVGAMAAPSAPDSVGPQVSAGGFRACFARSPRGALFAAANFWALITAKPAAAVLARLAADTPARADAIAVAESLGSAPALGQTERIEIAGYRFVDYDRRAAVVYLAVQADTSLISIPTELRWEQGDWRYLVPATGDPGFRQVTTLAGYVPWGDA